MQRRKLLAVAGGTLTTAIAGCIGTDGDSESTPESPPQVEVEFAVEGGALVVTHVEGDVLQAGQTVYVTVAGETATETTLSSDVHTGGEIIRVPDAEADYHQSHRVGLYLKQEGEPRELATGEVSFGHPAPNTQIAFDYTTSGSPQLKILHDGGDTIDSENTGKLKVTGDVSQATWNVGTESGNTTTSTTIDSSSSSIEYGQEIGTISSISSGNTVTVHWVSNGGDQSSGLGKFEAP
ncbi:hypothetical protein [Halobacterium yunchengense]|uniref:hypothetical protein n=1 Tax=Halobacterium yunchengense TaxID=3108497 RepID=UPI003008E285